jgi:hypothetical protein
LHHLILGISVEITTIVGKKLARALATTTRTIRNTGLGTRSLGDPHVQDLGSSNDLDFIVATMAEIHKVGHGGARSEIKLRVLGRGQKMRRGDVPILGRLMRFEF